MKMADLPGRVYGEAYWDPKTPMSGKFTRKSEDSQKEKARARARRTYERNREKILARRAAKRGAVDFVPGFRGRYDSAEHMKTRHDTQLSRTGLDG